MVDSPMPANRARVPRVLVLFTALALGACSRDEPGAALPAAPAPERAPATPSGADLVPAQWLGRWNGPEGTYLDITGAAGQYRVTVANLDGPREFPATVSGGLLSFERDGLRESVRATNGEATGMKWLLDKRNCLTVKTGEGYCRD